MVKLREQARRVLHALFPSRADGFSLVLVVGITACVGGLLYRVYDLQTNPDPRLADIAGIRTKALVEPGRRGMIVDRIGRPVAVTDFGSALIIDPVDFPGRRRNFDSAIVALAECLSIADQPELIKKIVGDPLMTAAKRNFGRWAAAGWTPGDTKMPRPKVKGLDRYVHIGDVVLSDRAVEAVTRMQADKDRRLTGLFLVPRPVRQLLSPELIAPIVGQVGIDDKTRKEIGKFGVELRAESREVQPESGRIEYARDAAGKPLWVVSDGYTAAVNGQNIRLAIDLELQRMLIDELERGVDDAGAAGGRAVMIDVITGEVVALHDTVRDVGATPYDFKTIITKREKGVKHHGPRWRVIKPDEGARASVPNARRNRCVEDIYEPGSTFKPFMWSMVMANGYANLTDSVETGHNPWHAPDGRTLTDVTKRDSMTVRDVLVNSSNIGMVKLTQRLSPEQMHEAAIEFGFGRRTGIELPGETPGVVTSLSKMNQSARVSMAIGHQISVTPVQMVRAFSAFCRTGDDAGTIPDIHIVTTPKAGELPFRDARRVLAPTIAGMTRGVMRGVMHKVDENMKKAGEEGWRYELFGKSGTAQIPIGDRDGRQIPKGSIGYYAGQYFSSFIAGGPYEQPRLAMIVVIDDPSPKMVEEVRYYGSLVAGPVVRRTMDRALAYLGVPASPLPDDTVREHGGD